MQEASGWTKRGGRQLALEREPPSDLYQPDKAAEDGEGVVAFNHHLQIGGGADPANLQGHLGQVGIPESHPEPEWRGELGRRDLAQPSEALDRGVMYQPASYRGMETPEPPGD